MAKHVPAYFGLWLALMSSACGKESVPGNSPPPAECPLDENTRFTFTSLVLDTNSASSLFLDVCSSVDADTLNDQADAGTQACEVTPKDGCRADVACKVMGVDIDGEVAALEDGIFGRFDVTVPNLGRVCSYDIEATVNK